MEADFLRRVYKASAAMAALIALCGAAYIGALWALAFLLAAAWSVANLWTLERLLTVVVRRGRRTAIAGLFCLKLPVLYAVLALYLLFVPWSAGALLAGLTLPYAVIVLKALGLSLVESMGRTPLPPRAERESLPKSAPDDE